jgi:hypothetical protein
MLNDCLWRPKVGEYTPYLFGQLALIDDPLLFGIPLIGLFVQNINFFFGGVFNKRNPSPAFSSLALAGLLF